MSKICFDPQEKSSIIDRILLDTETSKKRKEAPLKFFLEIAMELEVLLDFSQLDHFKVHKSLEQLVSKMTNLVTLCIRLKSDSYREDFKCYRPALNGLKSCHNLKEFILVLDGGARFYDTEVEDVKPGEVMHSFMDMVVRNCPNITK